MNEHFKVVCGTCKCAPGLMSDADGEMLICPSCGQRDGVDEAFRIAGKHYALNTARHEHMPLTGQTSRWQAVSV